jgi:hypothetical protein
MWLQGIKCKYSGCGPGFRCVVFDDDVSDQLDYGFGFCMCEVNSGDPACGCGGSVSSADGRQTWQCGPSAKDTAMCVPVDSADFNSLCYTVVNIVTGGVRRLATARCRATAPNGRCLPVRKK